MYANSNHQLVIHYQKVKVNHSSIKELHWYELSCEWWEFFNQNQLTNRNKANFFKLNFNGINQFCVHHLMIDHVNYIAGRWEPPRLVGTLLSSFDDRSELALNLAWLSLLWQVISTTNSMWHGLTNILDQVHCWRHVAYM